MKKSLFILLISVCIPCCADNYKILQMNTSSLQIGNVLCKQGDTFSDESPILWTSDKQAIKGMNLQTKQIRMFVSKDFKDAKAKSIKEYFLKSNHLSTRGGAISFSDLAEELSETQYILGTLPIESPVPLDSLSSYVISYVDNGIKKWCTLMSTESMFFLNRELFNEESQNEYTLSLFYRRRGCDDYLITDGLHVILLPERVDE